MPQTNQHIEALIAACQKGDRSAQMEIYDRYSKAMFNTAFRIVHDDFEAEDIMQEAFLTAFTKLNKLKDAKLFGAWLKKIVVNSSIGVYQEKKKRNEIPFDQVLYKVETEESTTTNEEEYTKLEAKEVLETIKKLKDNYRTALTLYLIEGYDYEEISSIMNISYANCRTTVSRAKESLRKKLKLKVALGY